MRPLLYAAALAGLCAAAFAVQKAADDADAKKTFESVCSQCHDLAIITTRHAGYDDWTKVVQRMAGEGASATDDQYLAIVDYLTRNYGPARLNVNQAAAPDLAAFFAISEAEAAAMVKYRNDNGAFKTVADLFKSGADREKIEAKKDAIDF